MVKGTVKTSYQSSTKEYFKFLRKVKIEIKWKEHGHFQDRNRVIPLEIFIHGQQFEKLKTYPKKYKTKFQIIATIIFLKQVLCKS